MSGTTHSTGLDLDRAFQGPSAQYIELDPTSPTSPSATSAPINISGRSLSQHNTSWESMGDFSSPGHASPAFPYTPSYQGSFNGSEHNWGGREEADPLALFEDNDVDYNPNDYDGPPSSHHGASFALFDENSFAQSIADESVFPINYANVDQLGFRGEAYNNAPSPASSSGSPNRDGNRSRASSVASFHPGGSPMMPVKEFNELKFDPVQQDLDWHQNQLDTSLLKAETTPPSEPALLLKPQSPPTLVIPAETSMPSLPSLFPPEGQLGLVPGPSIHIVPSTPVSGGGGGTTNVPFQTVLRNLTERNKSQQSGSVGAPDLNPSNLTNLMSSTTSSASRPSTPSQQATSTMSVTTWGNVSLLNDPVTSTQPHYQQPYTGGGGNFEFPPTNYNFPSTATSTSIPISTTRRSPQLQAQTSPFLDFPMTTRHRSKSDTQLRSPLFGSLPQQGTVDPSHVLPPSPTPQAASIPSMQAQTSNMSNLHNLHPFSFPGTSDTLDIKTLGADLRRSHSDSGRRGHSRGSRSEDLRGLNGSFPLRPITTPDGALAPNDPRIQASTGPTRHVRRGSAGHERNSSLSSGSRVSPYPSPSQSPQPVHHALPTVPSVIQVERQHVTTPATEQASIRRRKTEATFSCPVPGCGSTFTRHFNLKGHLRSHNEERPFVCKWPGCGKGFARQHDCKRHEALHQNIRPFSCKGCKKTFARLDALNRHLKSDGGLGCAEHHNMAELEAKTEDTNGNGWPSINGGGLIL